VRDVTPRGRFFSRRDSLSLGEGSRGGKKSCCQGGLRRNHDPAETIEPLAELRHPRDERGGLELSHGTPEATPVEPALLRLRRGSLARTPDRVALD